MSFIAGILILLIVINCIALILLILMQLPKKDAGAGMAFGGAAADALFGAGSGNFLTQATKYATIAFFLLALLLGHVETKLHSAGNGASFTKKLQQEQQQSSVPGLPPALPATAPAATSSNALTAPLSVPPMLPATSNTAPAAPTQSK
jgi:preprotein translocase subunit SecG